LRQGVLFPKFDGTNMTPREFNAILERAGDKIGMKVHPHKLRRSGATAYVIAGGPTDMARIILGHRSIRTTEEYIQIATAETVKVHDQYSPASKIKIRSA